MTFLEIPALNNLFVSFFSNIDKFVFSIFPTKNISVGLSIIIMTIIIRTLLVPLYVTQMKSMNGMSKMGPEAKKLQTKYKNDPKKLQEETSKLYKEYGVNPLGGCLPLLFQMPILLALYNVFSTLHLSGISFLWIHDLSKSASMADPTSYILPIVSALTTYLSGMLMSLNTTDEAQRKQSSTMNIVMSVVLLFMSIKFNAALVLYWVTGNIFQVIQSRVVLTILNRNDNTPMKVDSSK